MVSVILIACSVCVCSYLYVRLCGVICDGELLLNVFAICVGEVTVFSLKVIVLL